MREGFVRTRRRILCNAHARPAPCAGPPVARTAVASEENPFQAVTDFFGRFTHSAPTIDVDECIVDAENLDEIRACRE